MFTKGHFTNNTPTALVAQCKMPDQNLDLNLHVYLKATIIY